MGSARLCFAGGMGDIKASPGFLVKLFPRIATFGYECGVPRSKPNSTAQETCICERLLAARRERGLSRVEHARRAGIDSSQLRRYEEQLVPLRFEDARKLANAVEIGLRWLATGKGSAGQRIQISDEELPHKPAEGALLSDIFDSMISQLWEERGKTAVSDDQNDGKLGGVVRCYPFGSGWVRRCRITCRTIETRAREIPSGHDRGLLETEKY